MIVRKYLPKRSAAWQEQRREKLRALAREHPARVDQARVLCERRKAFEKAEADYKEVRDTELGLVAILTAHGFSLTEIAYTLHMTNQAVSDRRRLWQDATS